METKSKKEWMKNVIIVFLVIMLLLTLFSNTITNYTLPQVSTAMVTSEDISTAVRGTGNISAGDAYTVKATESRTILSVNVSKGDHVDVDTPIFTLKDQDSEELAKARDELADLELKYYKSLLTTDMSTTEAVKVNNGGASSFNSYINKLASLEEQIEAAEQAVLDKQQMIDNLEVGKSVEAINQVGADLEKSLAETAKTDAQESFNTAKNKYVSYLTTRKAELTNEKTQLGTSVSLTRIRNVLNAINDGLGKPVANIDSLTIIDLKNNYDVNLKPAIDADHYKDYATLLSEADQAFAEYNNSLANDGKIQDIDNRLKQLDYELSEANNLSYRDADSYKEALGRYNAAIMADYANKKTNAQFDAASTYAKDDLTKAKTELERLKTEKKDLATEIGNALDADKYSEDIVRKKEDLAKLESKAMGATINAPVSGIVQSISKAPGESFKADEEICVIIPDGKDMTVKISVPNNQAKKVKIGDTGVLANSWAFPDAVCVVKSITDDTDNPGKNSVITFTITGSNLIVGQSINVSVETDMRHYETVVPKSALKKDNSGDFVYVLVEKTSPLGNRYIAKKVTVTVSASDDNKAAVVGDLSAYNNSVITSSNKMVEGGKQVRLSESNSN